MSLSPFLGCISNKFKIKYLLPEVGSAAKLSGEWYKRFWSSQSLKKFQTPTTRTTTSRPHIHIHKMK